MTAWTANKFSALGTLVRLHARAWRRHAGSMQNQSTLMLTVIWLFVFSYWVFGYQLFFEGLRYIGSFPGIGNFLLERLLRLFFAFLLGMLFFSNLIIGYATLFRNAETQWLLGLPVPFADVLRWKTLETMLLASWAFLFLSGPLLLAYGMVQQYPLQFYLKAALLYGPFLVIPAAAGTATAMLLARFVSRRLFKSALLLIGLAALVATLWFLGPGPRRMFRDLFLNDEFARLMARTKFSENPFWPSAWLVESLLSPYWVTTLFYAGVLISNALLMGLLVVSASGKMFYAAWSRVHSAAGGRWGLWERAGKGCFTLLERALARSPCSGPTRALILKDARTFLRDTVQWSQFAIFFGVLGLYVVNLRHASESLTVPFWANLISFLNLTACAMTLATLTTRFVFPQFSLEGKRLWVLGLAPGGLRGVLLTKFWLASAASAAVTVPLMLVSSLMLKLNVALTLVFCGTVVMMAVGLSGLAVGLGALYPNLKDDNPSKIVSGFGGTFCLVMSMTYVSVCVGLEAYAMHFYFRPRPEAMLHQLDPLQALLYLAPALLSVALLSVLAAWIPLRLAIQRLKNLEV